MARVSCGASSPSSRSAEPCRTRWGRLPHRNCDRGDGLHQRSDTDLGRTPMKVIGAGLPRTATLTQKVALEMLGVGPCYHMVNVLSDLTLADDWRDALEGRADWDKLLGGFESTVDWPGGFFYRELLDAYPDAKVLLSVRDPAAWEHSMRDTV